MDAYFHICSSFQLSTALVFYRKLVVVRSGYSSGCVPCSWGSYPVKIYVDLFLIISHNSSPWYPRFVPFFPIPVHLWFLFFCKVGRVVSIDAWPWMAGIKCCNSVPIHEADVSIPKWSLSPSVSVAGTTWLITFGKWHHSTHSPHACILAHHVFSNLV